MKFSTLSHARYYANQHKSIKVKIIKSQYWSMDQWKYVPCYTVVLA
jgi:hypothetical protein